MDPAVQPNPIRDALEIMLELQDKDDKIHDLKRRRRQLQEQLDESRARVETARASQADLKKNFDEEKKKRGLYELEVKAKEEEIKKHNQQLADCKTNEAYSAKLNEIKAAKDARKELEEKIIQLMESEEGIQKEFEEKAKDLETQTKQAEEEQQKVQKEADGFEGEEKEIASGRQAALDKLPKSFRELYERRLSQRPVVIRRVTETQVCGACSMKVPAQQINELKKLKQFTHCQSCGVILAIGEL